MKELIVVVTLLSVLFTCSNLSTLAEKEDDPDLFRACQAMCQQRYSDSYGVQDHRRVTDEVILCTCMRHRGDRKVYLNLEEFEEIEAHVEVEVLKP